jgi:predicted nucleic acid-binding protein
MIVADTNVITYLYLPDRRSQAALAAHERDPDWVVPFLWRSEFRNVLTTMMRADLLDIESGKAIFVTAQEMMQGSEYFVSTEHVLDLAADSGCSAYDCEFVSVSRELSIPLVTEDRKILMAFPDSTVSLEDFASL